MTVGRVRRTLASVFLLASAVAIEMIASVNPVAGASTVVAKGGPELSIMASGGVVVGGTVSAGASLAGATNPTGTIAFRLYGPDDATCTRAAVFTSAVSVSGNGIYGSDAFTPTTAGTYRWKSDYSGDAANTAASTPCDDPGSLVVVAQSSPVLRIMASGGVGVEEPVSAGVSLAGGTTPTGSIAFRLYGPGDAVCGAAAVFTSAVEVSGNGTYGSGLFTPTAAGTYRWRADYSGDANHAPASTPCDAAGASVVVARGKPALSILASDSVAVGASVSAGASLAGGAKPSGTMTFVLFGPDDATCVEAAVFTSAVDVSANGIYDSGLFTPMTAGTYRWRADYSGDANNTAASTACNAPTASVVAKGVPTLATMASGGGVVGRSVSAGAALAGGAYPSGTMTFELFGPDDAACAGVAVFTSAVNVSGNGVYDSGSFIPTAAGTYRWRADYSGDANNTTASTPCDAPGASMALDALPPAKFPPYHPAAHPREIVNLEVAAFALLTALTASAARRAAPPRRDSEDSAGGGEIVGASADNEDRWIDAVEDGAMMSALPAVQRGDRSRTWRWPVTRSVDRMSLKLPERVAPTSPLLARVISDASYLRAMFGSASAVLVIVGISLGILAVRDVGGAAWPPQFSLAVALAVVGVFDALAGIMAVAVFTGGVVLLGGLSSAAAARTLLGLASLWFAAPLIAGAARPLRRAPTVTLAEHWDRLADIVIASLIGAWAVQKILQGLPGLAGLELPIADQANRAALVVLAALVVRMMIETLAAHWYPRRLSQVQPTELPGSRARQRLAAKSLTLIIFLFAAIPYVGVCWQLYVGAILFIVPQLLGLWQDRLPNVPKLHVILPHGIDQIVTMLFVGALVGSLVLSQARPSQELIRDSFVLLSLPGFALSLLDLAGREGPDRELHWSDQILGTVVLVFGVLFVLGVIGI